MDIFEPTDEEREGDAVAACWAVVLVLALFAGLGIAGFVVFLAAVFS